MSALPGALIETDWLEGALGDPALRVLDCTVLLVPDPKTVYRVESGRARWQAGHIPGAAFVDLQDELSDNTSKLRFTLPQADAFAATMSRLGVGDGTHVVLYSTGSLFWATRVWWMLRAFGFDAAGVLNGGYQKWTDEKRPVSTQPSTYPTANFTARPRPELFASRDDVRAALDDAGTRIVNSLGRDQHAGTSKVHYGRPGRIPGSVCVPAMELVQEGTEVFRPPEELREALAQAGALDAPRVITYCGGGIAATSDAFALTLLGHQNVAVYDGSMSDWASDPSLPMERD